MRTPRSASRTAIRQPRAVLPGPYRFSVASLSLRMSKTSGASVCIRYAVSIELIAASSCGSCGGVGPKFVELLDQIELAALLRQREFRIVDVRDQLLRIEILADDLIRPLGAIRDERALMHRRQKRVIPQRRSDRRRHVWAQDDIAGKILVVGAESVRQPRSERWTAGLRVTGVHHEHRGLVVRNVGVDRANEADVVGAFADVRKELADFDAALSVLLECERRLQERAGLSLSRHFAAGQRLAVVFLEHRLVIEAVDLRQAAVHVEKDHALGARGMIEFADVETRVLPAAAGETRSRDARRLQGFADEAREREHAESVADLAERVATGHGFRGSM